MLASTSPDLWHLSFGAQVLIIAVLVMFAAMAPRSLRLARGWWSGEITIKVPGPNASFNDRLVYGCIRASAVSLVAAAPLFVSFLFLELGALTSIHLPFAIAIPILVSVAVGLLVFSIVLFNWPKRLVPPSERSARGWLL
jgi:hypothetical protein